MYFRNIQFGIAILLWCLLIQESGGRLSGLKNQKMIANASTTPKPDQKHFQREIISVARCNELCSSIKWCNGTCYHDGTCMCDMIERSNAEDKTSKPYYETWMFCADWCPSKCRWMSGNANPDTSGICTMDGACYCKHEKQKQYLPGSCDSQCEEFCNDNIKVGGSCRPSDNFCRCHLKEDKKKDNQTCNEMCASTCMTNFKVTGSCRKNGICICDNVCSGIQDCTEMCDTFCNETYKLKGSCYHRKFCHCGKGETTGFKNQDIPRAWYLCPSLNAIMAQLQPVCEIELCAITCHRMLHKNARCQAGVCLCLMEFWLGSEIV